MVLIIGCLRFKILLHFSQLLAALACYEDPSLMTCIVHLHCTLLGVVNLFLIIIIIIVPFFAKSRYFDVLVS